MKIGNMNQSINVYGGVSNVTHQSGKVGYNGYYEALKKEYSDLDEETVDNEEKTEDKRTKVEESTTDTDIIVKPDGSRVLVVTTNIGGMTTNMSLRISEPTKAPNEISETDVSEEENQNVRGWNKGTGIFTAGSEWSNAHAGGV